MRCPQLLPADAPVRVGGPLLLASAVDLARLAGLGLVLRPRWTAGLVTTGGHRPGRGRGVGRSRQP